MSEDRTVHNMMNLAKSSGLVAEGKEELMKIFLKVVYQASRFDALIDKIRKESKRDGEPIPNS